MVAVLFLFGLTLTTACSKNIMPPEGLTVGNVASQMKSSKDSGDLKENSGNRGDSGSGFLIEEDIDSSGNSRGFITGSGEEPISPRGGAAGSNNSTPFLGSDNNGGTSDNGGTSGNGDQFAQAPPRLHYKETNDIQDIIFKFDRYDLDDESRAVLRNNVTYLKKNSMTSIEVQGHCDERGTNNYNIALGERRAHATKMYMVSQGISASRIHTISYGEEKPFCFDSNDSCWLKNRRAHFKVDR
jgi:peptidoglycan-associated lipoprotein